MKKTHILRSEILVFFCIFSFVVTQVQSEDITTPIIYVGGNGSGNFTNIQTAINNATAGSTIFVYNGTYHENLVIEKPLILSGESKNGTIINGDGNSYVVTLAADNVSLSNFTITDSGKKFPNAGIYVNSDSNIIFNNILTDNYYGIQLGYSVRDNLIMDNTIFHNSQCGVYFNHASQNILIGNVVADHRVNGFGLFEFSNDNRIINNTFSENRNTGVNIRESYQNQVIGNTFTQDTVGLHKPAPEYQTIARDNTFADNAISLEEERDAIVFTVVIFDILVFFVFLVLRKISL